MRPIRVVCWSHDETRVQVCHGYVGGNPTLEWLDVEYANGRPFARIGRMLYLVGACQLEAPGVC
jgi:hypothetical protein